jgi:hypothetical protein
MNFMKERARSDDKALMTRRTLLLATVACVASAQGLDGLFLQMKFAFGSFQENHYFFTPDGRYLAGVPEGGLTAADLDRACAKAKKACGAYQVSGGKLILTPLEGQPQTLTLEKSADGNLKLDGLFAKRAAKFPAGAKLEGKYFRGGSAGPVSAGQSYVFRADGTFSSTSLGAVNTGQGAGKSETAAAGTYRLSGNLLELNANGAASRIVAYPYDLGGGDVRLNLNGVFFKKQN